MNKSPYEIMKEMFETEFFADYTKEEKKEILDSFDKPVKVSIKKV